MKATKNSVSLTEISNVTTWYKVDPRVWLLYMAPLNLLIMPTFSEENIWWFPNIQKQIAMDHKGAKVITLAFVSVRSKENLGGSL